MARLEKLFNANYLHDIPVAKRPVNEKSRNYIDRFVSENYNRLSNQFKNFDGNINSSGFGALDKLNETLYSLYINPDLSFASWEEAQAFLRNKFTEKEMRVSAKKTVKCEEFPDEECLTKILDRL